MQTFKPIETFRIIKELENEDVTEIHTNIVLNMGLVELNQRRSSNETHQVPSSRTAGLLKFVIFQDNY